MKRNFIKNILTMSLAASFLGAGFFANRNKQVVEVNASAQAYWSTISESTINSGGQTLMEALRTKVSSNVTTLSYDALWTAYKTTDLVPGTSNKIWDMYGGFQFTYGTDQGGNYSDEGDKYNREHSVPQSWFNEASPMKTDLVHVVPTDGKVNGVRSNYAFGEVATAEYDYSFPERKDGNGNTIQVAGHSKLGKPATINGVKTSESKVFEPDDQYKGDFARIYMYFATRYQGVAASGAGATIFSKTYPYLTQYGLQLVRKWHEQDPVSQKEMDRNNGIEDKQKNRNPFVDHPEWANSIFGTSSEANKLIISALNAQVYEGKTITLSATSGDSSTITWSTSNSSVVSISKTSSASNESITVTGVKEGSATITASATVDGTKVSQQCNVTVIKSIVDDDKGLSIDNPLTPEEAVNLMAQAGEGNFVGNNIQYYVRGTFDSGTTYDSTYQQWTGSMGTYGGKTFKLVSATNNSGVTIEGKNGALDGKEVIAKGFLELYNGSYKMGYLPASASPTGSKFVPSIVYIEGGTIPQPTPTPTPEPTPEITVSLSKTSQTVEVGNTFKLTATTNSGQNINWILSNTNVGLTETTTTSGQEVTVLAAKAGTTTITAKSGGAEAKCVVTIIQPVITIELSETKVTAFVGETFKLKATTSNLTQVAWSKDNDLINLSASISGSGMEITVSCLEIGEAKITAKSTSGEEAYCYVTIVEKMEPTPTPTPTPEPTPTPTPTPEPEPQPSKKGCGGNVVSSSIIVSSLALSSLGFVLLRIILKKHK